MAASSRRPPNNGGGGDGSERRERSGEGPPDRKLKRKLSKVTMYDDGIIIYLAC